MNTDLSQSATQPCSEVKTKAMKDKVGIVSLKDGPLKSTLATILEHEVLKHCGIFCVCAKSVSSHYRLRTETFLLPAKFL